MAKIAICEDNNLDLPRRYGFLGRSEHDISVYYYGIFGVEVIIGMMVERGFNESKLHDGEYDDETVAELIKADIIFFDGLGGRCWELIKKIPEEDQYKVNILSGNPKVINYAKEHNYPTYRSKHIEELVSKLDK
jgi:hypothetical protein